MNVNINSNVGSLIGVERKSAEICSLNKKIVELGGREPFQRFSSI